MAQPTAFRHQNRIHLNRADGTSLVLTTEEAAAIAVLVGPSAAARDAAERHLEMLRTPLGRRHDNPLQD